MTETTAHSYRPLWILIAVTVLPFIGAWIVFLNPSLMEDMKTTNRGELVEPPRPFPALSFETLDGQGFDSSNLTGHWSLLSVADADCGQGCQTNLYHMRQIRLAMGEERRRIHRIMVLNGNSGAEGLAEKLGPYEGTTVITGPTEERDRVMQLLQLDDGVPTTDRLFLIDPLGNLMMAYPQAPEAKDVLKDLERLIQVVRL